MTAQKNSNSEGKDRYSEGSNANSVLTPCSELMPVFSFNRLGLAALKGTPRVFSKRGTQGERGGAQNGVRKYRFKFKIGRGWA